MLGRYWCDGAEATRKRKYSNVSEACIIIMHYAQIMRTGVLATQTPAAHPTTRRAHTRTPSLATEESHTHARAVLSRFFANGDYGGVQAPCAVASRRSCKREQHESFRTASGPAHLLLERGNRTHDGLTVVET